MIHETDLDNLDLPKANYNEQLETLSEQNFQTQFDPSLFEFCTRDRRDKGLDITYEIKRANKHTGFRFIVQLKSTESIKPNKSDGSYSLQMDTSNINYLLNNSSPAFYVLYVVDTKTFYYESLTHFIKTLYQKDDQWELKGSHVLKFHKLLCPEAITEIYEVTQKNGLLQRNLKSSVSIISASLNRNDRISIDADFNLTDDVKIREMVEVLGFELINEGRWREILTIHKKASGNVATSSLYNFILGIANYYGGSRWDAKSFLKKASTLKASLSNEMQMQLRYFDTTLEYSIGLINEEEYHRRQGELINSGTVGLFIRLDNAKRKYMDEFHNTADEKHEEYLKEIEDIINHPNADLSLKLTAKCEVILFQGFKNNSDFITSVARINALEEILGPNVTARLETAKRFIEIHELWYKNVEIILEEAATSKNNFAYFTALTNQVKILYQFDVFTSNIYVIQEIPGYPKPPMPDKTAQHENWVKKIGAAANFFSLIGHIDNTIVASATFYELLSYVGNKTEADRVMAELENLADIYDLKDDKKRLEHLRNGGTTHETFANRLNDILSNARKIKAQYDDFISAMVKMDEEERNLSPNSQKDNLRIHLFPIGFFSFPKDKKTLVYEILNINEVARKTFDNMFNSVIPIANIYYNPITQEGTVNGNLADRDIESWRNIYRIRKEFYENKFYRFEIPGFSN